MDKKRLLGLIILIILIIAIPLTLYLVRQTQIFKPRAGDTTKSRIELWQNNSSGNSQELTGTPPTVTDPNVQLKIYYVP